MAKVESLYVDQYKGKHRLLLVFSPDAASPAFESQMNLLDGHVQEVARLDVVLGTVLANGRDSIAGRQIDRASEVGLREDLRINPDDFCVVLIDKDGEEILRAYDVVEPVVFARAVEGGEGVPLEQPGPGRI